MPRSCRGTNLNFLDKFYRRNRLQEALHFPSVERAAEWPSFLACTTNIGVEVAIEGRFGLLSNLGCPRVCATASDTNSSLNGNPNILWVFHDHCTAQHTAVIQRILDGILEQ